MRVVSLLRGRSLMTRLTQPADEYWDRRLGVRTFGYHPAAGSGDRDIFMHYIPSTYRDVFSVLRLAGIGPDDVVTDLGSGLGRVVFAASWAGARRAEGVERVPWLADAAQANLGRSRLRQRDIRFSCDDARHHDFAATTLLYMFHPFGEAIVEEVIGKARADRQRARATHRLRLAYVNPVAERVLERSGWLQRRASVPARAQRFSSADHYPASVWESLD